MAETTVIVWFSDKGERLTRLEYKSALQRHWSMERNKEAARSSLLELFAVHPGSAYVVYVQTGDYAFSLQVRNPTAP